MSSGSCLEAASISCWREDFGARQVRTLRGRPDGLDQLYDGSCLVCKELPLFRVSCFDYPKVDSLKTRRVSTVCWELEGPSMLSELVEHGMQRCREGSLKRPETSRCKMTHAFSWGIPQHEWFPFGSPLDQPNTGYLKQIHTHTDSAAALHISAIQSRLCRVRHCLTCPTPNFELLFVVLA